jgi:hypothetical protein
MSNWNAPHQTDLGKVEKDRQIAELKARSPLRKPIAQDDVDGLALFDAQRSPVML